MNTAVNSNSGFTLLEVMLAILIIAIAFSSVMTVQQVSIQEAGLAVQTKLCVALVERKMGEILTDSKIEEGFSDGGDFADFPGYEWRLDPVTLEDVVVSDPADSEADAEKTEPRRIFKLQLTVMPANAKETDYQGIVVWATKLQEEDEWHGKEGEETPPPAEGPKSGPGSAPQGPPPGPQGPTSPPVPSPPESPESPN
ncbi:MAG: type II secretion system protein [Planctomycetes bacterium]|nr:type II secretion system protein [Planctomycetota bacterium]